MPTRAKIEEEIAALATEVRELARRRGAGLPDVRLWVDLILALAPDMDEAKAVAARLDEKGPEAMADLVRGMALAPAAEPLKAALLEALEFAVRGGERAYRSAVQALRPVLGELLRLRGAKWHEDLSHASHSLDLYHCTSEGQSQTGERFASALSKANRAELVAISGLALRCAADDLDKWTAWYAGGEAQKQHHFQHASWLGTAGGYCSLEPAVLWRREKRRHELPLEEDAALIERGLATQEQVDAVRALPPISPGRVGDSR